MKFRVERNFIVRTEEELDLNPENFLYCANIEELNSAIDDYISDQCEHPKHPNLQSSEEIGMRFWNNWWSNLGEESFYTKWQKLKGLPEEL